MTSFIHKKVPEEMIEANGINPQREPPNILPTKMMPISVAIQRPVARFSRVSNIGWYVMDGVGWNRTLVFSPRMGTSDVVPSAMGSGGAVTSWLCLYSGSGCVGSVLMGYTMCQSVIFCCCIS